MSSGVQGVWAARWSRPRRRLGSGVRPLLEGLQDGWTGHGAQPMRRQGHPATGGGARGHPPRVEGGYQIQPARTSDGPVVYRRRVAYEQLQGYAGPGPCWRRESVPWGGGEWGPAGALPALDVVGPAWGQVGGGGGRGLVGRGG